MRIVERMVSEVCIPDSKKSIEAQCGAHIRRPLQQAMWALSFAEETTRRSDHHAQSDALLDSEQIEPQTAQT